MLDQFFLVVCVCLFPLPVCNWAKNERLRTVAIAEKKWLTYFLDSFQFNCVLLLTLLGGFNWILEISLQSILAIFNGFCEIYTLFVVCTFVCWHSILWKEIKSKIGILVNLRWMLTFQSEMNGTVGKMGTNNTRGTQDENEIAKWKKNKNTTAT